MGRTNIPQASCESANGLPTSGLLRAFRDNQADTKARFSIASPHLASAGHTLTGKHSWMGHSSLKESQNLGNDLNPATPAMAVAGNHVAYNAPTDLDLGFPQDEFFSDFFGAFYGVFSGSVPNADLVVAIQSGCYGDGRTIRIHATNLTSLTVDPASFFPVDVMRIFKDQ